MKKIIFRFSIAFMYGLCADAIVTQPCTERGQNCTLCLSDGQCGFCDSCGDHCHLSNTMHSWENCTSCAQCIPGTLIGPKKGHTCRHEWYYYEKCPEVVSAKKTVYVGIALYLMNLHSVDMKAGTFHADFYLYFKVPPGQTLYTKQKCKNEGLNGACFDLVNAAGSAEVSLHEGKYFRVKGKFNFAADLSNFPFDNQTLKIEIQDMEMTAKELRWRLLEGDVDDNRPFKYKSGISPTLNYTGWVFDSYSWSQIVYERYNPFLDEGVSRYAFRFHMARPKRAAFFKIFLPPLFIVVVICFAFAIPPSDATMRVWIDGNLLVSCVMFHSTMSEQAPDTQDATLADMFLVGVYGFIFVSFMVSIILLKLQRKKLFQAAETFYRYAEWMVWFTAPTYFLLLYYIRICLYHTLLIVLLLAFSVAGGIKACTYIRPGWFSFHDDTKSLNSPDTLENVGSEFLTRVPRLRTKSVSKKRSQTSQSRGMKDEVGLKNQKRT
ncbi:uncharacterized protein LOC130656852 [Hydractinia symbiolongicarpus]|uniref:uncharacterized protein LOC130656852 n=1 Tax=Hydractinia symbiolongicarpus TaxID=13093 RepID=UPI00254E6689|nr:uncharacterized protein LOC130656852 [Hydractinia symbiolongicarpus]